VAALARSASLERLELGSNHIGDEGARRLANASGLQKLTHLGLSQNQIGTAALAELLASENLPCLSHLDLRWNAGDAQLLSVTPARPRQSRLRLRWTGPYDLPPEAFTDSPLIAGCVGLDLASHPFTPAQARALAGSSCVAGLRALGLVGHAVSGPALFALGHSPHLAQLEELHLESYSWDHERSLALLDSGLARRLKQLTIRAGDVLEGPEELSARAGELAHLERLTVSSNFLQGEARGALGEALGWRLRVG
jgi:hypothetical protein